EQHTRQENASLRHFDLPAWPSADRRSRGQSRVWAWEESSHGQRFSGAALCPVAPFLCGERPAAGVSSKAETMRVMICGGGAIGACTAYALSRRGIDVLVVERTGVAAAASGKAGGFLALDWCAGPPLDALARRSFQLHAALPREIAGDWAYQRMTAYSGAV